MRPFVFAPRIVWSSLQIQESGFYNDRYLRADGFIIRAQVTIRTDGFIVRAGFCKTYALRA